MNSVLYIGLKYGQKGGRGSRNPKILQTSYKYRPLTRWRWPQVAAACSGVHFSVSVALGSPPYEISSCIISSLSSMQHWWRAVRPSSFVLSGLTPISRSRRTGTENGHASYIQNYLLSPTVQHESHLAITRRIRIMLLKLRATHYELREFSSSIGSIAFSWREWLGTQSIFKQKFTKHILGITESNHATVLQIELLLIFHPFLMTMLQSPRSENNKRELRVILRQMPWAKDPFQIPAVLHLSRRHASRIKICVQSERSVRMEPMSFRVLHSKSNP